VIDHQSQAETNFRGGNQSPAQTYCEIKKYALRCDHPSCRAVGVSPERAGEAAGTNLRIGLRSSVEITSSIPVVILPSARVEEEGHGVNEDVEDAAHH